MWFTSNKSRRARRCPARSVSLGVSACWETTKSRPGSADNHRKPFQNPSLLTRLNGYSVTTPLLCFLHYWGLIHHFYQGATQGGTGRASTGGGAFDQKTSLVAVAHEMCLTLRKDQRIIVFNQSKSIKLQRTLERFCPFPSRDHGKTANLMFRHEGADPFGI